MSYGLPQQGKKNWVYLNNVLELGIAQKYIESGKCLAM